MEKKLSSDRYVDITACHVGGVVCASLLEAEKYNMSSHNSRLYALPGAKESKGNMRDLINF